ncbi:MAG: hypothetical protein ACLFVU_04725 [Phycisphaerae bacterium]
MKILIVVSLICLVATQNAVAVNPSVWEQSTEADFSAGQAEGVVVSSLGEIRLSRKLDIFVKSDVAPQVIAAVGCGKDGVYVLSGADTDLWLAEKSGKLRKVASVPGTIGTAMTMHDGALLVGTGGKDAGLYRVTTDGKIRKLWDHADAQYVWSIAATDDAIYVATGPKAKLFRLSPGKNGAVDGKLIYECPKLASNLLSLAWNGSAKKLYVGTDNGGYVIEVDPAKETGRVVLDSDEGEISALLVDADGGVYAATSDVAKASPDGTVAPSREEGGKAEPAGATRPATAAATGPATSPTPGRTAVGNGPRPTGGAANGKGNAVYYIHADGLVSTIFRQPVAIYSMALADGKLMLGTGNGGALYTVSRDGDELTQLADTDAKQITGLCVDPKGTVYFATSNNGSVGRLSAGFAKTGTFTSNPLDAKQAAQFGTIRLAGSSPRGGKLTVATRSGNTAEPDEKTWSSWSKEMALDDSYLPIGSPAGRFFQYRLSFRAGAKTSPVVSNVKVIYQLGNLAPMLSAVTVKPASQPNGQDTGEPMIYRLVMIKATDPNNDKLTYRIEFRKQGSRKWIVLAEDLAQPKYLWDTRKTGDGRYDLRVIASDAPSNPAETALTSSRLALPVLVDSVGPQIKDLKASVEDGKVTITGKAVEAASRITSIHYAVNSQDDWHTVLPADGIADSRTEKIAFDIPDLKPGTYRIAVRVADLYGNVGFEAVTVDVAERAKDE